MAGADRADSALSFALRHTLAFMRSAGRKPRMEVPPQVDDALEGASVIERIDLGAEDALFFTSEATLHYRGEGLLSDAGVDRYPHDDVTGLSVTTGRRKATIELTYAVDDDQQLTVPEHALEDVLEPLLAGILASSGVLAPEETVTALYRFSELTLVITSEQLLKHVGDPVWDPDYEALSWGDVTGLDVEEGDVAAQLVVETASRSQRTKIPRDTAVAVHRDVEAALCAYHGVSEYAEFVSLVSDAEDDGATDSRRATDEDDLTDIGLEPLGAGTPNRDVDAPGGSDPAPLDSLESTSTTSDTQPEHSQSQDQLSRAEIASRLEELEAALANQAEVLETHRETLAELREELSRDQ